MRFEDFRLLKTFPHLHDQKPVRLPPVILFSTNCAPPLCVFSGRDPPTVVFQRETSVLRIPARRSSLSPICSLPPDPAVELGRNRVEMGAQWHCLGYTVRGTAINGELLAGQHGSSRTQALQSTANCWLANTVVHELNDLKFGNDSSRNKHIAGKTGKTEAGTSQQKKKVTFLRLWSSVH